MWRMGLTVAAGLLAAPAWSQAGIEAVVERLAAQGYAGFEIEREAGTIKVEAVRNGVERELVYDAADGRLIEDSQRAARAAGADDHGGRAARADRAEAGDDNGGRADRDDRSEAGDDHGSRSGGRGGGGDSDDDDSGDDDRGDDDRGDSDDDDSGDDDHGGRGGDDDSDDSEDD